MFLNFWAFVEEFWGRPILGRFWSFLSNFGSGGFESLWLAPCIRPRPSRRVSTESVWHPTCWSDLFPHAIFTKGNSLSFLWNDPVHRRRILSLRGDFPGKFGVNLWDLFGPTQYRLKKNRENFGKSFVRKFVPLKNNSCQHSLCRRANLAKHDWAKVPQHNGNEPRPPLVV